MIKQRELLKAIFGAVLEAIIFWGIAFLFLMAIIF